MICEQHQTSEIDLTFIFCGEVYLPTFTSVLFSYENNSNDNDGVIYLMAAVMDCKKVVVSSGKYYFYYFLISEPWICVQIRKKYVISSSLSSRGGFCFSKFRFFCLRHVLPGFKTLFMFTKHNVWRILWVGKKF